MKLLSKITRFRAYQLGAEGSSYSYFNGEIFTLIEARYNDVNEPNIKDELKNCSKTTIDTLHITSWDQDHCTPLDLENIFKDFKPKKIEYPGYEPHTDTGKESLKLIKSYKQKSKQSKDNLTVVTKKIDPAYIKSLDGAEKLTYHDIFYNPKKIYTDSSNNNSTIKFLRSGAFNVASMGDVEDNNISSRLRRSNVFSSEVDVLVLPHHGANNGFITNNFLKKTKPTVAICTSNYDNQYDHPTKEVTDALSKNRIPYFTTKTGDVIIKSIEHHTNKYQVLNLVKNNEKLSSEEVFIAKKSKFSKMNKDSIKNLYNQKKPYYNKPK